MRFNRFAAFLALVTPLAFAGCDDLFGSGDSKPGVLETSVPTQGESAVSVLSPIQLVFDKKVKLADRFLQY